MGVGLGGGGGGGGGGVVLVIGVEVGVGVGEAFGAGDGRPPPWLGLYGSIWIEIRLIWERSSIGGPRYRLKSHGVREAASRSAKQ